MERTRLQGSQSPLSLLTRFALKVVQSWPPSPTLLSTSPHAGPSSLHLPLLLLCLSVLGLASSFLNCQDHSSIAKLSCHPHLLSLPLPGRLLPGGSGQRTHVLEAGLLSPWDWGVAGRSTTCAGTGPPPRGKRGVE